MQRFLNCEHEMFNKLRTVKEFVKGTKRLTGQFVDLVFRERERYNENDNYIMYQENIIQELTEIFENIVQKVPINTKHENIPNKQQLREIFREYVACLIEQREI